MNNIKKTFREYFENWNIELPKNIPKKGSITKAGWCINYILLKDNSGNVCLDFTADHRMTNPRHHRILHLGKLIWLDAYQDMLIYNPKVKGDEERAEKEFEANNEKVTKELIDKGLVGEERKGRWG